jgi:hypothetical protein
MYQLFEESIAFLSVRLHVLTPQAAFVFLAVGGLGTPV